MDDEGECTVASKQPAVNAVEADGPPVTAEVTPNVNQTQGPEAFGLEAERDDSCELIQPEKPEIDQDHIDLLLKRNQAWIQTYQRISKRLQDKFNFELDNTATVCDIEKHLEHIISKQKHPFKVNLSFGFILTNVLTQEPIFYYASNNNRLLDSPVLVRSRDDIPSVLNNISKQDILEYCRQQRSSTKFVVTRVTNVLYYVNKIKKFHLGASVELPAYIKKRRCIVKLVKDRRGQPYLDNFCILRCVAVHRGGVDEQYNTAEVKRLLGEYCNAMRMESEEFEGVALEELGTVENTFHLNIEVYALCAPMDNDDSADGDVNGDDAIAIRQRASRKAFPGPVMNLNLYGNHFSYITDVKTYSKCWACRKCDKLFDQLWLVNRHEPGCAESTRLVFPGWGYGERKSVFDELLEYGIDVPEEDRYFPYRLAYDFEALSIPRQADQQAIDKKEVILRDLVPASVSIVSNVRGFEDPKCFISNGDPLELIEQMYEYFTQISAASYEDMTARFAPILEDIDERIAEEEEAVGLDDDSEDESESPNNSGTDMNDMKSRAYRLEIFKRVKTRLDKWMSRVVALGFNSGKFDINLCRRYLFPYFLTSGIDTHIIKRGNDYLAISTDHCTFLDMKNYLAAGISYDKWLKSYDVPQTKGHFPYDWLTDLEKLDEQQLVGKEHFWSEMRQEGISDEDYSKLEVIWREGNFQTMRDFLIWYNNLDVQPFLVAAQRMVDHWKGLGIDMFKGPAISLPGLALTYMMKRKRPHSILPLFGPTTKDFYHTLRANIVGGLSVVMHRYHEVGITILPNGQPCGWIYSHDANSLYLSVIGQETGVGVFAFWIPKIAALSRESMKWERLELIGEERQQKHKEWNDIRSYNMLQNFTRSYADPYWKSETEWIQWTERVMGVTVETKYNGRQKVVHVDKRTCYPVDGYIPSRNTILQFHGCRWHGHKCQKNTAEMQRLRETTQAITDKLREMGYLVIEKWECEWRREKAASAEIKRFVREHLELPTRISERNGWELLDLVKSGYLFGMVECDIEVSMWDDELQQHFKDYPPIFKNTNISIDDIGDFMREYAESNGYMRQPRRMLINSYWGRKIVIATPLLKWYLSHGLTVTRIYRVCEMKAKACFADIMNEITEHRRRADRDPSHKPQADSWKTVGNSCYGKPMTNKEKHKETLLKLDEHAGLLINDKRFSKMEEVGDIAYELTMDRKKIVIDLPLTVSFFVYHGAKLRMLEFIFDFLTKYLRPGSFQMICSDTDSVVAAYESKNLDDLVKPDMWDAYVADKKNFLAVDEYSQRTPGLFKVEMEGNGCCALCSKTYIFWNGDECKVSSKGLSKRTNKLTRDDFLRVLETQVKGSGVNYGLKVHGDGMCQYKQRRDALSYLYVKRRVLDDGITTEPLLL